VSENYLSFARLLPWFNGSIGQISEDPQLKAPSALKKMDQATKLCLAVNPRSKYKRISKRIVVMGPKLLERPLPLVPL